MLSNIVVQKIFYLEVKKLLILYKKEIEKYISYSLLDYFRNLLFPKNKNKYYKFIRIIFLFFIIRFIIDIVRFFFNFYYITLNWFFYNLKFSVKFYTDNELIILFYSKIVDFIRYFILFIPLVNISNDLMNKKMTLIEYIFMKITHKIIKIIRWRPKRKKKKLIYILRFLKFIVVFFGLQPAVAIKDFFSIVIRIFEIFYLIFMDWILFFRLIYYVWTYNRFAGVAYLRKGSSLFHIAVLLQKHGFKVPKSNKYDKMRAIINYRSYCRRYKKNELPPDYLNDEALDIYVFLLELFSDTRYELRRLPIKEFFFIVFPYEFLMYLFIFLRYLYIGIVFILYYLFFLLVFFYLCLGLMFDYVEYLKVIHFMFFRDLSYLEKEKDKIWIKIRENAKRKEKREYYIKKYSPYFNYLNSKLLKIIKIIKNFYEKIVR